MKMAKKVLSVVLAVIMALSCFAVAASAWGVETSERKIKVTLNLGKAENGAGPVWAAGRQITCNTGNPDLDYAEGTNIYAKPGETVWVYETVQTNFYVWGYGAQIFYDARLIDAHTEFNTQLTGKTMGTAQEQLVHQWNQNNAVYGDYGLASTAQAPWGLINDDNRANVAKAWPTDEEGNLIADYAKDGAPDTTKWAWARHNININPGSMYGDIFGYYDAEYDIDTTSWLFRFPVKVPTTAQNGTVYTITIPEGMIQRNAKKTSAMYCYEMADYGMMGPVSTYTPAFTYPSSATSGEQYWDLSAATVTITVGEESTLDYTELDAAITAAGNVVRTNAVESTLTALDTALDAANTAKTAATTQTEINDAAAALNTAIAGVKYNADYTALDAAIGTAGTKVQNDYTAASWAAMQTALADANNVARNLTSDDQATINNAAAALNTAIDALVPAGAADYTAVNTAKAKVPADSSLYTAESWAALETAIGNVEEGLNENQQAIVDGYAEAIEAAIRDLVELDADYTALNNAKEAAAAKTAGKTAADYTADSWATYTAALDAANAVAAGLKKSQQATIDTAAQNLTTATEALVEIGNADYTALDAEIAAVPEYEEAYYTADTWAVYAEKLTAAQNLARDLKATAQATVNAAKDELAEAKTALTLKNADYTAVDEALANAGGIERIIYTDESLATLDAAIAAVVDGKKINEQAIVNGWAEAINTALENLDKKDADYTAVNTAKAMVPADSSIYTEETWAALQTALGAVVEGKKIDEQAIVDGYAEAINTALENLDKKDADYTAVDAAKAMIPADLTIYTDDSVAALNAALGAVVEGKKIDEQAAVNKMAEDIEVAILGLVEADADYSALAAYPTENAYKGKITSKIDSQSYLFYAYTAESWAAYDAAVKAVPAELKKSQQATVDAAIADVDTAYKALVPSTAAEYIAIQEAKLQDSSAYTAESWAAYEAAKAEALKYNCVDHTWGTFGKSISGTNGYDAAYNALELKPEEPVIDYTALEAKYNEVKDTDLTDAIVGKDAFENALAVAAALLTNRDATAQATVDGSLDELTNTFAALKYRANYADLQEALADAENYDEADYTAATWAAFAEAVRAGRAIDLDLTTDDQTAIDDATSAIVETKALLLEKADTTALVEAINAADAKDEALYTEESWAVLEAAVVAGEALLSGDTELSVNDQANINEKAAAITAAIAGLKEKSTEPEPEVTGIAKEINFDAAAANGWNNDYEIKLEGRPMMVQFYEVTTGNTNSYDRYNSKVTIVSYDNDGEVVDSDNIRKIAYEVWTIEGATVGYDTIKVRAKANGSPKWEDKDADLLTFVNEAPMLDAELKGDLVADKSGKPGNFAISGTVGKDAIRVQVKMADGSTNTATLTQNEDGTQSFTVNGWANLGENTVTVRAKASDGTWSDLGTVDYTAAK